MAAPLSRGQCVEWTLATGQRIRGQITGPGRSAGSWLILGTDAVLYEQPADSLHRLSGSLAKSVVHATKMLLIRKHIRRQIRLFAEEPRVYVPKPRVEPDKKRSTGGWDGAPGYGARPEPQRFDADGHPIRPSPRSSASDIPYELHEHDEWGGESYGCGLEWTPQFERYISWATGPYCNALADMDRQDPRLKLVYICCVEQERRASDVAAALDCSRITVWRLRAEAERIMGNRRKRQIAG